jgi:hypothetical protein
VPHQNLDKYRGIFRHAHGCKIQQFRRDNEISCFCHTQMELNDLLSLVLGDCLELVGMDRCLWISIIKCINLHLNFLHKLKVKLTHFWPITRNEGYQKSYTSKTAQIFQVVTSNYSVAMKSWSVHILTKGEQISKRNTIERLQYYAFNLSWTHKSQ